MATIPPRGDKRDGEEDAREEGEGEEEAKAFSGGRRKGRGGPAPRLCMLVGVM